MSANEKEENDDDVSFDHLDSSYSTMSTFYENYPMNPYSQYLSSFNSTNSSTMSETTEQTSDDVKINLTSETSIDHDRVVKEEDDDEYCQICGDVASGWHCG